MLRQCARGARGCTSDRVSLKTDGLEVVRAAERGRLAQIGEDSGIERAGAAAVGMEVGRVAAGRLGLVEQIIDLDGETPSSAALADVLEAAFEADIDVAVPVHGSCWVAIRCFEARPDGRVRFAHSAPWHVDIPGSKVRPRKEETDFLIARMEKASDPVREGIRICVDLIVELATIPGIAGVHIMAPGNDAAIPAVIAEAKSRVDKAAVI